MSVRSDFRWNGDRIIAEIQRKDAALRTAGEIIRGQAIHLCPIGVYPAGSRKVGGNLSGSITYALAGFATPTTGITSQKDGLYPHGRKDEVWIGTNVHYAVYVEKGTRKMTARPYLFAAYRQKKDEVFKRMRDIINQQIGSIR